MADTKLSALTELSTLSATDHLYVSPLVTGTRRDRRMTAQNLATGIKQLMGKDGVRTLAMSGDITLDGTADYAQFLDPDGANRLVTMISGAEVDGQTFVFQHAGSANTLTIRNIATATILVLYVGWSAILTYDATAAAWGVTALTLPTTHAHTGAAGDGAQISYNDLDNIPVATEKQSYFEDFTGQIVDGGINGIFYNNKTGTAGLTASSTAVSAALKTIGVVVPYCTSTSSYTSLVLSPTSITFGYVAFDQEWKMRVTTLSDVTDEYAILLGFHDVIGSTSEDPTVDGAYFRYRRTIDGDFWACITRAASDGAASSPTNETKTVTSVAPSSTYRKFRIVVNAAGTSVEFYIDTVLVATHTTNVPTGSNRFGAGFHMSKSAGSTLRSANIDYFLMTVDATTGGR